MASPDETPNFEEFDSLFAPKERWKPSPEIEHQVYATLKDVLPLKLRPSDKDLEQFYDRGYQLYKTGQYKAALPYFKILNMVNPRNPKYLMAAAACSQMMKEYHAAVGYYTLAAILDDQNPYPQYHMADCLIKLEEPFQALIALEMGVNRCDEMAEFKGLKNRMELMMARLHKELEEKKAAGEILLKPIEPKHKPKDTKT